MARGGKTAWNADKHLMCGLGDMLSGLASTAGESNFHTEIKKPEIK